MVTFLDRLTYTFLIVHHVSLLREGTKPFQNVCALWGHWKLVMAIVKCVRTVILKIYMHLVFYCNRPLYHFQSEFNSGCVTEQLTKSGADNS